MAGARVEQPGDLVGILAGGLVQRPGGQHRLAELFDGRGTVPIPGRPERLGQGIAGGDEIGQREAVEVVRGSGFSRHETTVGAPNGGQGPPFGD